MMHVYALKMWGRVTGDIALESRYGENRLLFMLRTNGLIGL